MSAPKLPQPAYAIFIVQRVHDRAGLERYWAEVGRTFAGRTVKMLAGYGRHVQLEGTDPALATVIAEFPSMDEALDWYHSPAYTAVRQHRLAAADVLGVVVEGGGVPVDQRLR